MQMFDYPQSVKSKSGIKWAPKLVEIPLCACGCGAVVSVHGRRPSVYRKGHHFRKHRAGEMRDGKTADAFTTLRRKYNIKPEDYYAILNRQDSKCAICKSDFPGNTRGGPGKRFDVDHCHITGRIRGLLCRSCNRGLGSFKDSEDLMRGAILYLENSKCTF